MPKILVQGCVATCDYCCTKFAFQPSETVCAMREVPPGYSPEEEAYTTGAFSVSCPNCHQGVRVDALLGGVAKAELLARAVSRKSYGDDLTGY